MARVRFNEWVPINKCYTDKSVAKTYEAAADVEVEEKYNLLDDYFYTLLEYARRNDCALDISTTRDVISIAFRIGFLRGGRAAMNGDFKEPPEREENGAKVQILASEFY